LIEEKAMDPIPDPKDWKFHATAEEIKAFYEKAKREFSENDLRLFFTEEEGVPFESVLAELEEMSREHKKRAHDEFGA
jgi:hypothetical protein